MFAKVSILCAVFAAAHASVLLAAPALVSTGVSTSSRQQDAIGNYAFNYGIADGLGATNSRAESGDAHGNKIGSYTLTDIDGRARRVDYVADSLGFRASVKTNEPGTALSAPAAAAVISPYAAPVAPVAAAPVAPIVAAAPVAAYAAPVAAYSNVIGHGAALAAPYGIGLYGAGITKSVIGNGAALASPYGLGLYGAGITKSVIGNGAALASPYGLGLYGPGITKSLLL